MALVSDIMLDGLTKTMEKLCTLVSELMLWITSLLLFFFFFFWGGGGLGEWVREDSYAGVQDIGKR